MCALSRVAQLPELCTEGDASSLEAAQRLARRLSHDLNNVLAVVTGLTDVLLERAPNDSPTRRDLPLVGRG